MKRIFLLMLIGCGITSCTPGNKAAKPTAERQTTIPQVDSSKLIIPGKSIGKLYLNQDMDNVFRLMGKADAGDAAMGKAWGIWFSNEPGNADKNQVAVYSSYKDSTMSGKSAKEILVTASHYQTAGGLKTGLPLNSIKKALPALKQVGLYVNNTTHDTLEIHDDVSSGIAFEVKRQANQKVSTAVFVHPKNHGVNETYLTIYPGWRKL